VISDHHNHIDCVSAQASLCQKCKIAYYIANGLGIGHDQREIRRLCIY
jgi:hypothetical protein